MKAKVKTKKVKMARDPDLAEMFNKMLDVDSADFNIIYTKYGELKDNFMKFLDLLDVLVSINYMKTPENIPYTNEIIEFKNEMRHYCDTYMIFNVTSAELINGVDKSKSDDFTKLYQSIKSSKYTNSLIVTCNTLVEYKKNFVDLNNLNPKFVYSMPTAEWIPFSFTKLNIKSIFETNLNNNNIIMLFMTVLNKAYDFTYNVYKLISTPDIDTDKFVDVIMNNIDQIQKIPELSRCRKAFNKIKNSVDLLKNNFNNYYRDFVSTKDTTIIMQHFVIDVSKSIDADLETTREFKEIIKYYKKYAQSSTNPEVHKLLDKLQKSFDDLEKTTPNMVDIDDEICDTNVNVNDYTYDADQDET